MFWGFSQGFDSSYNTTRRCTLARGQGPKAHVGWVEVLPGVLAIVVQLPELVNVEAVVAVVADVVQDALDHERLVLNLGESQLA